MDRARFTSRCARAQRPVVAEQAFARFGGRAAPVGPDFRMAVLSDLADVLGPADGRNGSIDWLCWPRFDSTACFAALLGTSEHGRWRICPVDSNRTTERSPRWSC
jgi:hypothetical protein